MKRRFICTVCPVGCEIDTVTDDTGNITLSGNSCKRGEAYVRAELTDPQRTVTTTVMRCDGVPVSVRTDKPVPRRLMLQIMDILSKASAPADVRPGDVLTADILGTGADIVVTGVPE